MQNFAHVDIDFTYKNISSDKSLLFFLKVYISKTTQLIKSSHIAYIKKNKISILYNISKNEKRK